jgi:hypothetical protein
MTSPSPQTVRAAELLRLLLDQLAERISDRLQETLAGGQAAMTWRRVLVERGIYPQPNGKYAVCVMIEGKACVQTVGAVSRGCAPAARTARSGCAAG